MTLHWAPKTTQCLQFMLNSSYSHWILVHHRNCIGHLDYARFILPTAEARRMRQNERILNTQDSSSTGARFYLSLWFLDWLQNPTPGCCSFKDLFCFFFYLVNMSTGCYFYFFIFFNYEAQNEQKEESTSWLSIPAFIQQSRVISVENNFPGWGLILKQFIEVLICMKDFFISLTRKEGYRYQLLTILFL